MTRTLLYFAASVMIPSCLVFAGALENLDATLSKANSVESFLGNVELKNKYKKEVDAYTGQEDFNCRGLGNNLRELDVLQSKVHGFSEKMFKPTATPVSFEVDGMKITQVPRPFHAVWLTKATEGCGQRACTDKDKILRDPYTAVMDGTKFFIVEKEGKFTGSSITVLPVKRDKEKFDLVLENDSAHVLSAATLNKVLDKVKRLSKRTVLAVKLNKNKADTYYSFDGEPYFPLSEVKLEDPRAEQIFLAVGRRCGNGTGASESDTSNAITVGAAPGAVPVSGAPVNNNSNSNTNANNFMANLTINNQTGEASKELSELLKKDPKGLESKLQDISKNAPDKASRDKAKDLLSYAKNANSVDPGAYPIMPGGSQEPAVAGRSPASISSPNIKLGSGASRAAGAKGVHSLAGSGAGSFSGASTTAGEAGFVGGGPGLSGNGAFPNGNTARGRSGSGAGSGSGASASASAGTPPTLSEAEQKPVPEKKSSGADSLREAAKDSAGNKRQAENTPHSDKVQKEDNKDKGEPSKNPASGAAAAAVGKAGSTVGKDGDPVTGSGGAKKPDSENPPLTSNGNTKQSSQPWDTNSPDKSGNQNRSESLLDKVGNTIHAIFEEEHKKPAATQNNPPVAVRAPFSENPGLLKEIADNQNNPEYVSKATEALAKMVSENTHNRDAIDFMTKLRNNPQTQHIADQAMLLANYCSCKACDCCTEQQIRDENRNPLCKK